MYRRIISGIFFLSVITLNAQTINLGGKITDTNGQPVANAVVILSGQGLKDTTESDGIFAITKNDVSVLTLSYQWDRRVSLNRGILEFTLPDPSPVKVEAYDVKGNLLKKQVADKTVTGTYRFNITDVSRTTKLLIIRALIGRDEMVFRYLPIHNGSQAVRLPAESISPTDAKMAQTTDIDDTLEVSADGFKTKKVAITSYENSQLDITLESETVDEGAPCPSAGCGKELSDLKSGTYKISSAGLEREYIIEIPDNYDKNTPYRLILTPHMMGGDMEMIVGMNFYEMKTYAKKDNIPVIFVSPQGYTDSSPWRVNDDKDHVFFRDMLKLFKEKLCVDTSRIFCCGFSYGAMVSYSLSTAFQDELRAVATYAPANWNIYLPENNHKPIAYYQTTGTADNLCKWINSDARKEGGKYCVLQHLEDNGCEIPSEIPLATGNTHVTTEFECDEKYPVAFGSHTGGHSMNEKDGGGTNWIAKETWEFFMRF
jgi:poly(3-hydroxybutyrate) depolymerase